MKKDLLFVTPDQTERLIELLEYDSSSVADSIAIVIERAPTIYKKSWEALDLLMQNALDCKSTEAVLAGKDPDEIRKIWQAIKKAFKE